MATEPKAAAENVKIDLFEDDDEFEINEEWEDRAEEKVAEQWEDDWDDDDVHDDFSQQLRIQEWEFPNSSRSSSTRWSNYSLSIPTIPISFPILKTSSTSRCLHKHTPWMQIFAFFASTNLSQSE